MENVAIERRGVVDLLAELIGTSAGIMSAKEQVRQLLLLWSRSRRPPPMLMQGETGTGKSMLARALHPASPRAGGPFVDVNCAAIPDTLLEAELFGYERGAFTDARQAKPGLFQLAHRGTLFLDEIGLLPLPLQAKLLSVLEERAVRRLGGTRAEPADVWIIAATNEDLAQALRERRFREDLYHRIAVVTLVLPPLRDRGDDAAVLAEHFLAKSCEEYGLPARTLSDDARAAITHYAWPGNVRELSNCIERAALLAGTAVLTASDLRLSAPPSTQEAAQAPTSATASQSSRELLRDQLDRTLTETQWNISRTAAILGVSRNTVAARITRFGLRGPRKSGAEPLPDDEASGDKRPAAPLVADRSAHWEMRRLTFVRSEVVVPSAADAFETSRFPQLDMAAERLRGFGGRVEGVGKTVLIASFGIDARDEHAVVATHSALVIRRAASEMTRTLGAAELRIGIHVAEVPLRVGGGAAVIDADAGRLAWNAVDAAMADAAPGTIVATAPAAALVRRRFAMAVLDQAAQAFTVHGIWRNDVAARSQRGPFAGRRPELALLESRYASAARGRGQVIDIAGEAGIGKSRLLLELVASRSLDGAEYLEGRCLPTDVATPFAPLLQIAAAACGLAERDAADTIERKVRLTLGASGPDADDPAAALAYLLGAKTTPPEPPSGALKKRLFGALLRLLLARSARAPLVILVEDIHWIDPTSEACLAAIVEAAPRAPILLATTYRTGYRPPWAGTAQSLQLTLAPLSTDESLAVIRGLIEDRWRSDDLERRIQGWAEGNPLFLEELSRAALEQGDGSLGPQIPATIEDTIGARIGRLSGRPRRLLAVAAVAGREVPLELLREVAGVSQEAVEAAAEELERADFLYESGLAAGERRYTFKHVLVQETAYAQLSPSQCRALHLRMLDAIEKLYEDRRLEQVETLAHHAVRAGAGERSVRYLLQAGRKAMARYALAEAMTQLNKGLELLPRIASGPERDRRELELSVATGMVLCAGKGPASPETARTFSRARELLGRVPDSPQRGTLLIGQWYSSIQRSEYDAARAVAEELLGLGERDRDSFVGATAHHALGMTALYRGEFIAAREHFERSLALYHPEQHRDRVLGEDSWALHVNQRVISLAFLGRVLWSLGYPDRALASNREAVAQARQTGGALNMALALGMLTTAHQLRRDIGETVEASEIGIAHAREWGIMYWVAQETVLRSVAIGAQWIGPAARQAVADIQQSLLIYRATGATMGLPWFLTLLAETCEASGQIGEGLAALDEALALADATDGRYHEAESHRVRGRLLRRVDANSPEAEQELRRALKTAQEQQARGFELRAAIDLARLLDFERRSAEAHAVLAPAYAWFTEGLQTPDLREARALLETVGGPQQV